MKRTLISLAATVACLIISSTTSTAQSAGSAYNIPFSFTASGVNMPAGRYAVVPQSQTIGLLRGPDGSIYFARGFQLTGKPRPAHLTFTKYGNAYFLHEVWNESGQGSQVPKSPREREIQKTSQVAGIQPETVLLASIQ